MLSLKAMKKHYQNYRYIVENIMVFSFSILKKNVPPLFRNSPQAGANNLLVEQSNYKFYAQPIFR